MPRNTINIPDRIEYLSILNEKGELDASLEPDIPEEQLTEDTMFMMSRMRPTSSPPRALVLQGRHIQKVLFTSRPRQVVPAYALASGHQPRRERSTSMTCYGWLLTRRQ